MTVFRDQFEQLALWLLVIISKTQIVGPLLFVLLTVPLVQLIQISMNIPSVDMDGNGGVAELGKDWLRIPRAF